MHLFNYLTYVELSYRVIRKVNIQIVDLRQRTYIFYCMRKFRTLIIIYNRMEDIQ